MVINSNNISTEKNKNTDRDRYHDDSYTNI